MKSPQPNACLACELGWCLNAHVEQMLNANSVVTNVESICSEEVHNQSIKDTKVPVVST